MKLFYRLNECTTRLGSRSRVWARRRPSVSADVPSLAPYEAFISVVERDAARARAAVTLVLAQPSIGSQLVDNLNASIHLRTVLTDLFLLDEALKK